MRRNVTLMALVFAALMGCGNGGDNNTGPCAPNEQVECACGAGEVGYQVCNAEGSAYSQCQCNGGMGGSASTSSGAGSSGGTGGTGGVGTGGAPPVLPAYCDTGADVTYNCADCPISDSIVDGEAICKRLCSISGSPYYTTTVDTGIGQDFSIAFPVVTHQQACNTCAVTKMQYPDTFAADWSFRSRIFGPGCARITTSPDRHVYVGPNDTGEFPMCGLESEMSQCQIVTAEMIKQNLDITATAVAQLGAQAGWVRFETQPLETGETCTLSCP